jgi:hypothetical protein
MARSGFCYSRDVQRAPRIHDSAPFHAGLVAMALVAVPLLAACSESDPESPTPAGPSAGGTLTASGGATAGAAGEATNGARAGAPGTSDIYADVLAVTSSGSPGNYTLSVTIESADIDCSQYADWWEVLSEDGILLYRRILEHSHTDENGTTDPDAPGNTFTRSGGPVPIEADTVALVRAHLSNVDGYAGRVLRGTVAGGFVEATGLAGDFAEAVEAEPPQPEQCLF